MNGYPQGLLGALGLNEEDLRRQGMTSGLLNAGLQMLAASGPSPVRQSLGQIVAQGGAAGLQGMQQAQESAIDRALRGMQVQDAVRKRELEERQQRAREEALTGLRTAVSGTGSVSSMPSGGLTQEAYTSLMANPNLTKDDKAALKNIWEATKPRSQDLTPEAALYAQSRYGTANVASLTPEQAQDVLSFTLRPTTEQQISLARLRFETGMGIPGVNAPAPSAVAPSVQAPAEPTPSIQMPSVPKEISGKPLGKNEVPLIQSQSLSPKQKQELELKKPETIGVVEFAIDQTRQMANTARRLLANPNLERAFGPIGIVESKIPGTPAANILAELDVLRNQSFVQGLQAMRAASPTGGAVGNVSNAEGQRFENLQAALRQIQSGSQAREELERLVTELEGSENRLKSAFERTYGKGTEFQVRSIFEQSKRTGRRRYNPETGQVE